MTKKVSLKLSSLFMVAFAALFMQNVVSAQTEVPGNPSCTTLNGFADDSVEYGSTFNHIKSNWEFKVDPPVVGPLALSGSGLAGGMPATANIKLLMAYSQPTGSQFRVLDNWTLTADPGTDLTRAVTAVIVKGGASSNVYTYPTGASSASGPFVSPQGGGISHLSFCFKPVEPTIVTAADASISGRVVDPYGRGLSGATLSLVDFTTGLTTYVTTNTFGYYKFNGLEVSNFYNLDVKHRRYQFNESVKTISLQADLADVNFSAAR